MHAARGQLLASTTLPSQQNRYVRAGDACQLAITLLERRRQRAGPRGVFRRGRLASIDLVARSQHPQAAPELEDIAVAEQGTIDHLVVQPAAVSRAEVLELPDPGEVNEPRMAARHPGVVHRDAQPSAIL